LQKSRDSSYYQKFESKSGNKINFEFVNYDNDQLVGILKELRFIQKNVNGEDMLEVIETTMAVDNKVKTHNIGIGIYNLPKKRSTNASRLQPFLFNTQKHLKRKSKN
jgi:hypothetical protein